MSKYLPFIAAGGGLLLAFILMATGIVNSSTDGCKQRTVDNYWVCPAFK